MESLLGFIVLTGPLILIVVWVPLCVGLAVWAGKKYVKTGLLLKIVISLLIFLFLLVLPISDEIAGQIYFYHLCETKAGVKVYQTIELPDEYWNADGTPTFYMNWDENLGTKYPLIYEKESFSPMFHIDNAGYKFVDRQFGEILGEVIDFRYWGGWLTRKLSTSNTSSSCGVDGNLIDNIFFSVKSAGEINNVDNQ